MAEETKPTFGRAHAYQLADLIISLAKRTGQPCFICILDDDDVELLLLRHDHAPSNLRQAAISMARASAQSKVIESPFQNGFYVGVGIIVPGRPDYPEKLAAQRPPSWIMPRQSVTS